MTQLNPRAYRDVIVIGASAGGIEAIREIVSQLDALRAAIFVVVHTGPNGAGLLAGVLNRDSSLPVSFAEDGAPIRVGQIYVAPPDRHLALEPERMRLVHGPVENRHRPAVDVLFRSAANSLGPRVAGLVLSGYLDDGAAGLVAIKRRGGVTIVQDPATALAPGMPEAAISTGAVDFVMPLEQIPDLLTSLVDEEVTPIMPAEPIPINADPKGKPSAYTCPQCHGTLWEIDEGGLLRFACRVGHAFSAESMLEDQGEATERALWAAMRSLEERADLADRMGQRAHGRGHDLAERLFRQRSLEARGNADVLRSLLTGTKVQPQPERHDPKVEETA